MNKTTKLLVSGAVASVVSSAAFATPCDQVLSSYESATQSGQVSAQYVLSNHPECFGASTQQSTVSINRTSFAQISAVSTALGNRFLATPDLKLGGLELSGMAAATPGKAWNVWGNLTDDTTKQHYTSVSSNTVNNKTTSLTSVIGADYALSPTLVVGVSAAFDRATGDAYINGVKNNDLTNKGYTVAPYLGYAISKELALDVSAGFGQGDLSQSGNVSADADRWFTGVNLNYATWMGSTQLSGKLGWLHGEEKYEDASVAGVKAANTGAKNRVDQLRLGGQAAWWVNGGFMPYVGVAYITEDRKSTLLGATDPIGEDGWQWSAGVNFLSLASGVTGGIAYLHQTGRDNQKNQQLVANISIRF